MVWSAGANLLSADVPAGIGALRCSADRRDRPYEISRRRDWSRHILAHALEVRHSPAIFSIMRLAGVLFVYLIAWLESAEGIHDYYFGARAAGLRAGYFMQ